MRDTMARLLRYLPIAIPMIVRFFRSPQGKAAISKARSFIQKPKGGSTGTRH